MEHNTFRDTRVGVGTKFGDSPNANWIVQDNIFDSSAFYAGGDQPRCGTDCITRFNLESRGGTTEPPGTDSISGDAVYVGRGAGHDGLDMGATYFGP